MSLSSLKKARAVRSVEIVRLNLREAGLDTDEPLGWQQPFGAKLYYIGQDAESLKMSEPLWSESCRQDAATMACLHVEPKPVGTETALGFYRSVCNDPDMAGVWLWLLQQMVAHFPTMCRPELLAARGAAGSGLPREVADPLDSPVPVADGCTDTP